MAPLRKRTFAFAVGMLALLGALFVVSRSKRPPEMPADPSHRDLATNASCRPCHGKAGASPLASRHPPKEDCVYCHKHSR